MIRINLLKPLQPQAPLIMLAEPANRRKKLFLVGGGVIVVLAAAALLQYPSLLGGLMSGSKKSETVEVAPIPEPKPMDVPQPKRVTANAVEETVRDVGDQSERQAESQTYGDLVPSEKIEFQTFVCSRILKDIKAVTPPEVGFAHFIFTPPGNFYVHGLASDGESYQKFKAGLSGMEKADVRPGLEAAAGAKGLGKEFSFFGTVNYPVSFIKTPPNHLIPKAKLQEELTHLKTVAAGLGIKLKEPKLMNSIEFGEGHRQVYHTTADCDFQQMQDLFGELYQAKSNLGFIKFALHARGDEKVVAEMDILAYVN